MSRPPIKKPRIWPWLVLLFLAMLVWATLNWIYTNHQFSSLNAKADKSQIEAKQQEQAVKQLQQALITANEEIIRHGGKPVKVGPNPPSVSDIDQEVAHAVSVYCSLSGNCGAAPTATQVEAAVGKYCTVHGKCLGKPGPAPTTAQVAAAVVAYCGAHNGCTSSGSTGATGPRGPAGPAGQPPVSWTFTVKHTTYTCTRTGGFDPSNPTYSCFAD